MTSEEAAQAAEALYLKIFTQSTQASIIELIAAALLEAAQDGARTEREANIKILEDLMPVTNRTLDKPEAT